LSLQPKLEEQNKIKSIKYWKNKKIEDLKVANVLLGTYYENILFNSKIANKI
jgi:hypothetical protein